jgi:hypothetical protein
MSRVEKKTNFGGPAHRSGRQRKKERLPVKSCPDARTFWESPMTEKQWKLNRKKEMRKLRSFELTEKPDRVIAMKGSLGTLEEEIGEYA